MQELIFRVKQKDRKACHELYSLYAKPMYNVCLRLVNDEEESRDVLQESFVRIFQNLHTLSNNDLLSAWIKKICVNTSLQHVQQRNKWKMQTLDESSAMYSLQEEEVAIAELEFEGNLESIQKAIAALPERYRVVFVMHVIEDYSHEEIAQALGIVASTSRSQYLRAKQKLLEILKKNNSHVRSVKKISSAI